MIMRKRIFFQIFVVMIIINSFFISVPESKGACPCFFIFIKLNQKQKEQNIDMNFGEESIVNINGTVNCSLVVRAYDKFIAETIEARKQVEYCKT